MGKRSNFERVAKDYYPTPLSAVLPLLPHLEPRTIFAEPCAGDGRLVDHLEQAGHVCSYAADIEPRRRGILSADALEGHVERADCYITNPPWSRDVLHRLIVHLSEDKPTWLLFDADWIHTRQSAPFACRLRKIVSVGRVKWIENSKFSGKDNCAWHLFDKPANENTVLYSRAA